MPAVNARSLARAAAKNGLKGPLELGMKTRAFVVQ